MHRAAVDGFLSITFSLLTHCGSIRWMDVCLRVCYVSATYPLRCTVNRRVFYACVLRFRYSPIAVVYGGWTWNAHLASGLIWWIPRWIVFALISTSPSPSTVSPFSFTPTKLSGSIYGKTYHQKLLKWSEISEYKNVSFVTPWRLRRWTIAWLLCLHSAMK